MNFASLKKSDRLKRLYHVLSDRCWHSSADIQRKTRAVAVHSDVSELRCNGFTIPCRYSGLSRTGRKIYQYRLAGFVLIESEERK